MTPLDFQGFIDLLRRRMHADFDNVICLDGYEGSGKSTLGLFIALNLDPQFSADRVIYDHEDWDWQFKIADKQRVFVFDEGGNLAFNRDFSAAPQKKLVKILMQIRQLNSTLIMCIPNFNWLDKYIRDHRTRWRIHVHARGHATLQERRENWRLGTVWYQDLLDLSFPRLDQLRPDFWKQYQQRKWDAFSSRKDGAAQPRTNSSPGEPKLTFSPEGG